MLYYNIHINKYLPENAKVATGKYLGEKFRDEAFGLVGSYFDHYDKIVIHLPTYFRSINPSFLEPIVLNMVKYLGKAETLNKLIIVGSTYYNPEMDLLETIDCCQRQLQLKNK